jgi:hypothetical protein
VENTCSSSIESGSVPKVTSLSIPRSRSRSRTLPVLLVLVSVLGSCSTTQLLGWAPVSKPWEPSAIAKAAMVRATTTDGREVTLYRAGIVEEEGRTDLVGRIPDSRGDLDATERLDLATVTQLEMRRAGPASVSLSRSQAIALLTLAVLVLLLG